MDDTITLPGYATAGSCQIDGRYADFKISNHGTRLELRFEGEQEWHARGILGLALGGTPPRDGFVTYVLAD